QKPEAPTLEEPELAQDTVDKQIENNEKKAAPQQPQNTASSSTDSGASSGGGGGAGSDSSSANSGPIVTGSELQEAILYNYGGEIGNVVQPFMQMSINEGPVKGYVPTPEVAANPQEKAIWNEMKKMLIESGNLH
ncbi:MAG: hypothetical protein WCP97_09125, partial [bacterium]